MRAKPSSNSRSSKTSSKNSKSHRVSSKGVVKKGSKECVKKNVPDLSVLRQPVDTSVCGLKQAVKVFESGTPEVLHLLTYDCDVVYECKVCRNLFRSIANFISHKRIYCTQRYSRAQDLKQSNKEGEDFTLILGEQTQERLPTRITARKDLTSILESFGGPGIGAALQSKSDNGGETHNSEKKSTTIHLEPIENTSYGVFQTVLKPDSDNLMRSQVTELQTLLAQNEVVLGPDGRILQNGSDVQHEEVETESNTENDLVCSSCNVKFANRKTLSRHKRLFHESVRTCFSCPCCKNYFANVWSVYRHLYKVHRKTNEQVRRLRPQIHKKDVKIEKPPPNNVNSKKGASPSKKKADAEINTRLQQDNKEWMDHFEDDWELQRCGGCGRKFERKAALLSHAQICQKRIMACNRIKQNYQELLTSNMNPVVAVSPLPCSKKPVPKPSPEKKIGIQVRMNYCKNGSQASERQQTCSRSVLGDESDLEAVSVDGKESFFQQGTLKDVSVLDKFLKNSNSSRSSDGLEKVNSYLNNSANRIDKLQTYDISTCKRSTIMKNNMSKNKSLEAKCLQLRSALESGRTETLKNGAKIKELDNTDNMSESNTSAVSSLSSQLTPPVDKGYICEVEESIEIKNINISRSLETVPSTEADSTSMTNGCGVHMTFNSHSYTGNIKFSPNGDTTCEEVSTSVISDELPLSDSNYQVDSSCLQDDQDDEVSVDLKPGDLTQDDLKNSIQETELENTISILTRNQLKAICKDDLTPDNHKMSQSISMKKRSYDAEVESATREIAKKKLSKYIDDKQNQCGVCSKRFKTLYDAYRHIPTHTQWKRYECLFNGCTFQTFLKSTCLHHVTMHTRGGSGSALSLVGKIDPSKWNLKILKTKTPIQSRSVTKVLKKDIASQKLAKTLVSQKLAKKLASQKLAKAVNRLAKKPLDSTSSIKVKLKSKESSNVVSKQPKITKIINNVSGKQKLLTDFKHFNRQAKINGKALLQSKRNIKTKNTDLPKTKTNVNSSSQKKSKSSPAENVDSEMPATGNTVLRKQKVSTNNSDQGKVKFVVIKNGKSEEIIVNNMSLNTNEPILVKGRASRSSSRKSSINSIDQTKGKGSVEDFDTFQNAPVNSESQTSMHIQSPEIVDGASSQEEEESQESDRTVDDNTHFKKILEVIFGPTPKPAQNPGRPVRNKSRPKRDNDFILGSQKEGDKDVIESKSTVSKKSTKSVTDSKPITDISKKTK